MVAQTLSIYKSLIGNGSSDVQDTHLAKITGNVEAEAPFDKTENNSSTTAKLTDGDHQDDPIFSLQSPKREH